MKIKRNTIGRQLILWLTVLSLLLSIACSTVYATPIEGTGTPDTLTPPDESYESGNVILHKQAERIGPDEWKVTVKVTVGDKPVEKRKMEVVFVLDCSGSMAWCTDQEAHEAGNHTHSNSCWYIYTCGKEPHTHSIANGCAGAQCTQQTNPSHWEENDWFGYSHISNTTCLSSGGGWNPTYYLLDCDKEAHTHNNSCPHTQSDTPLCGRDECRHSSTGAEECTYKDADGNWVEYKTRLQAAKDAINTMVANLTAKNPENVSIKYVIFSSANRSYDNGVNKPSDQSTMVVSSIDNVTAEGGTYMYTGIETGIKQFSNNDFKKVLVVLTDGAANDNASSAPSLSSFKNPNGTDGTVFTVGFAYSNSTLAGIAGNGGSYVHAANAGALEFAFKELEQRLTAMLEDPMGTSVGFTHGSIEEIQNTSGVISSSGETIYWHPKQDGTDTIANSTIWYSYKVKLNEEADTSVGTHSNVPLNNPTSFMYGIESGGETQMQSAAFPIPKAEYALSSLQTIWQTEDGTIIPAEYIAAMNPDVMVNPTDVETVISDYSSATYIPAFTQPYQFNPPRIDIPGSNDYYRYVGTTVTADNQPLAGVSDVDATNPVAYTVVHKYELVTANEVYIDVSKNMVGRDFDAGDSFSFTFTIAADDSNPDAPLPKDDAGNVTTAVTITPTSGNRFNFSFGKMVFTQAGTYTYILKELRGDQDNMVYDEVERRMVVTVTETGTGANKVLTATYTITANGQTSNSLDFVNSLETGSLKVEKAEVISHLEEHQDKEFHFLLYVKNVSNRPVSETYEFVYSDGTTQNVTFSNGYGAVTLKAGQSVVINGLPDGATYTVTEDAAGGFTAVATGDTGTIVAHEQAIATFTNSYAASSPYQFFANKTLEGATLTQNQFSFTVKDEAGNVVARGKNILDGSIFFDTMTFTHEDVGEKTYYISEDVGTQNNILYDRTVYTVKLTITDNGDGTLEIVDSLNGQKITFLNKYITNQLTVGKNVEGNMANRYKEFPFTLTASGMAGQTINVSTDGGLTFQERTLDHQGKTEFTLKHGDNIIFYPVAGTYTVTETDHGSYTTSYSLNGAAAVNGTSVSGTIPADGSNSVRFVNTYNVGIPTGVSTPASAALVGIIVAMAMLAVVYTGRRWKVLEE